MSTIKARAEALSDLYQQIADLQLECKAVLEEAKAAGEDVKALRKVARELVTDSDKLQKKYDDEAQLELFRKSVQIYDRKGLLTGCAASEQQRIFDAVSHADRHLDGRGDH